MKNPITSHSRHKVLLTVLFLVLGISSFFIAYSYGNKNQDVAQASQCKDVCVALQADKAMPDMIAIERGKFVQFNSADGKAHSLSLGGGGSDHVHKGSFNSGMFEADEGWRVQFNDEGSFIFHDHLNPKINVLVVVYTPGKDYKIQP